METHDNPVETNENQVNTHENPPKTQESLVNLKDMENDLLSLESITDIGVYANIADQLPPHLEDEIEEEGEVE